MQSSQMHRVPGGGGLGGAEEAPRGGRGRQGGGGEHHGGHRPHPHPPHPQPPHPHHQARPKLEISGDFNKAEEEARLRALLRDDFIDDLSSGGFVPVQLPMVDTGEIPPELRRSIGRATVRGFLSWLLDADATLWFRAITVPGTRYFVRYQVLQPRRNGSSTVRTVLGTTWYFYGT